MPAIAECVRCRTPLAADTPQGICDTCNSNRFSYDFDQVTKTRFVESDPDNNTATYARTPGANGELETQTSRENSSRVGLDFEQRFQKLECLGAGGMGEVWLAFDHMAQRKVAIKFLRPELQLTVQIARFVVEARALAGLNHANVVTLHDFSVDAIRPYLCLEYIPGQTLANRIKHAGALAVNDAVAVAEKIGRGVQAANAMGVIHRDLKPSNVMLGLNGEVKVLDFGLAKRTEALDGITVTGQMVGGTPGFMAPEQLDPTAKPDSRVDVWGLGATLYALLAGNPPFPTGMGNITKVQTLDLVPLKKLLPEIPPEIDAVVAKCLSKNPAERYSTPGEVADDLQRWQRGEATLARPLTRLQKLARAIRKVPRSTGIVLAAVALITIGAIAMALMPKRTAEQRDVAELLAGRPVAIIGDSLPENREFKTYLEPNRLSKSDVDKTGGVLLANNICLCELMNDPGIDHYRIQLDMQLRGENFALADTQVVSRIALYFGHKLTARPGGIPSHTFVSFSWQDLDYVNALDGLPPVARNANLQFEHLPEQHNNLSSFVTNTVVSTKFMPTVQFPCPWRSLVLEVRPSGIKLWWEDPERKNPPSVQLGEAEVRRWYALSAENILKESSLPESDLPRWSPRMAFGIYSIRSNLAVRNVVLTPIEPDR